MVYYDIHTPASINGAALDAYLSGGWYRMQQSIFTTDLITYNKGILPVFWLRYVLGMYREEPKSRAIIRRNNQFSVTYTDGRIYEETEQLYAAYKVAADFDLSPSATDYLLGEAAPGLFNTRCIEVRDGNRLIAAGYFDEGDTSIAGILNFFHPDYKKFSLGKYLVLLKMEYALQQRMLYYYPGYFSTGLHKFDYKLFPCKAATEVFVRSLNAWIPWNLISKEELEALLFV